MNSSSTAVLAGAALIAGAALPVQGALNSQLRHALGSPLHAALISFLAGTTALMVAIIATRRIPTLALLQPLPWHVLIGGGLIGAAYVTIIAALASRLGVAALFGMVLTGQLLAAGLMDHYGLLGLPVRPFTATRMAGLILLLVGGYLATRS